MDLSEEEIRFIKENVMPPYNSVERYEEFILPNIQMHGLLCSAAIKAANNAMATLIKEHGYRFFSRIDDSHSLKSPASIIDKIRRSQEQAKKDTKKEPYTLDNFTSKMTDIARFRIVCNFLSDAEKIAACLEGSHEIGEHFIFVEKKSSINQHLGKRSAGERSIKLILEHKSNPGLFIEIQIVTQLQEAWDKKDHYLVYEKRRRAPGKDEETFPDFLDAKMFAMAELLYVADQYFEELKCSKEESGL